MRDEGTTRFPLRLRLGSKERSRVCGRGFASRAGVRKRKMSSLDYLELCRLCLVKDRVSVPIFEGEGDVRQIFLKIAACLPVKVSREDKLPKKICDDCAYKVELFYQFWNTTANAEKQLLEWLGEVGLQDKQDYITDVLDPSMLKQEQSSESRLDGNMQQVDVHENNMGIGMMDNMGLGMPIVLSGTDQQRMAPAVPMDTTSGSVTSGSSAQIQSQTQTQTSTSTRQDEEEESSEDEENSEEECDVEEGLPVKEENEEEQSSRAIEPTTFVNVSLACDEAGPSGLQQQKITEIADMPEMPLPQTAEGDSKAGYYTTNIATMTRPQDDRECTVRIAGEDRLKTEASVDEQMIQCGLCGDGFVSEPELREHVASHDRQQPVAELLYTDDSYVCEHCGGSFPTTESLLLHQEEEHLPDKEDTCEMEEYEQEHEQDSNDQQSGLEYAVASQELDYACEKPFQCDICQATFRYRQGLRLHAKLHQPDYVPPQKKHHCELCNKRFSRKQVLLVHMKTHGNVGGPQSEFICPVCGKAVSSKTYLTVHLRKHTGEKPHVCDLCGKAFISQNYLSVHRRTHTGERPHKCTHCEKRFTQRTTLVVHLRGHTGDRPYPCTCCHKSFASKTMLNSHLKTHAKQNARQQLEQQQQQRQRQQQPLQQQQQQQLEQQQHHFQQQEQMQEEEEEAAAAAAVGTTVTILLPS